MYLFAPEQEREVKKTNMRSQQTRDEALILQIYSSSVHFRF